MAAIQPSVAIDTASVAPHNTTQAAFILWAQCVHNMILSAGFTAVPTSQDMNFDNIPWVPQISRKFGYRVYAFNDSLQGTGAPIFFRLDYGSGATSTVPSVWLTVGASHVDGLIHSHSAMYPQSGATFPGAGFQGYNTGSPGNTWFTGSASVQPGMKEQRWETNATTTNPTSASVSGDGSWLTMVMFWGANYNQPFVLSLERTHDINGNDDSRGVLIHFGSSAQNTGISRQNVIIFASYSMGQQSGEDIALHAPYGSNNPGAYSSSLGLGEVAGIYAINFIGPDGPELCKNMVISPWQNVYGIVGSGGSVNQGPGSLNFKNSICDYWVPIRGQLHCYRLQGLTANTAFWVGALSTLDYGIRFEKGVVN